MRSFLLPFLFLGFSAAAQGVKPELFGTTSLFVGSVFSLNLDGSNMKVNKAFAPNGAAPTGILKPTPDGMLLGTYGLGGNESKGVIFKVNRDGSGFTKVYDFEGTIGGGLVDVVYDGEGTLYGATLTGGTIFRIDANGQYQTLHQFTFFDDIQYPGRLVLASDGFLYGTADKKSSGSIIFKLGKDGSGYTEIYTFSQPDEFGSPDPILLEGLDGYFYGAMQVGGAQGSGIAFKVSKTGTDYTRLHDFSAAEGNPMIGFIQDQAGILYGVTTTPGSSGAGILYKLAPDGSQFQVVRSFVGSDPMGLPALDNNSTLFGVVDGKIFSIKTDGSQYNVLTSSSSPQLKNPMAMYLENNTDLFVYTVNSFSTGFGGVAKYNLQSQTLTTLFSNPATDGYHPQGLTKGSGGRIFGVTEIGASGLAGSIFSLADDGTGFQLLHSFDPTEGKNVEDALVAYGDGGLFGVASSGGTTNAGTIFKINENGTGFTKLIDFSDVSANEPHGSLIKGATGELFGTTRLGGQNGQGIIFKVNPDGSGFTTLFNFDGVNGAQPLARLLEASDGFLYGTTAAGGANGYGVIFKISRSGSGFTKLLDFDIVNLGTTGGPSGALVEDVTTHALFGKKSGRLFKINKDGTNYNKLTSIGASNSDYLIQAPDGYFYSYGIGGVVKVDPDGSNYQRIALINQGDELPLRGLLLTGVNQTIQFDPIATKTISDPSFSPGATASSGLNVSYTSDNTAVATVTGSLINIVSAGTAHITAIQNGNNIYRIAPPVQQTLTVIKNQQSITFNALSSKTVGSAPFNLSSTASSGLAVQYASSDPLIATVVGNVVTIHAAGATQITASQSGNSIYDAASPVTQTLTVTRSPQSITFNAIPSKSFGGAPFNLSATSSSGLAVQFTNSDPLVATVAGNVVTIHTAGTTQITATQPGDQTYDAAAPVTQTLTITKIGQVISFPSLTAKMGDAPKLLSGTATSGLVVAFSSGSDKVSIAGNTVSFLKPGSATINADQPGNSNYNPATTVSQTFCILPTKPAIQSTGTSPVVLSSNSSNGNQWYKEGVAIAGATSQSFVMSESGVYTVKVIVDNCPSEMSDSYTGIVTGDVGPNSSVIFDVFPNPVKTTINFASSIFDEEKPLRVRVYDVTGRLVDEQSGYLLKSGLNVVNYSVGTFVLEATQGAKSARLKFIKE